jgi:threonine/homoserine/homoserine lactone efflux protein
LTGNRSSSPDAEREIASVLPQFAQPDRGMFSQLAALAAVFAALALTWLSP